MTTDNNKEIEDIIRRITLLNAIRYGGKARDGPVLGKLLAERPQLREQVKEVAALVARIVKEINRLPLEEQKRIVQARWPELLVKEAAIEERRELPPLPNVEQYRRVVTRFSPNPDCVLHLGSARAIILSYEYAKKYNGLFLLRFEDTDPRLKKAALHFYDSIREDIAWLGCKWDAEFIQSDRLPIYYEHAEVLLREGKAYVCTCKPEEFRKYVAAQQPCPCRGLQPDEQLVRWKRMLDGTYNEGEAVVRIKTDLSHPNPAVREWPALRIIDTKKHPHPRVGSLYRVWPLYNFACGVDDHLMGVTHIIRGKEHLTNQVRQEYLYQHLGWKYPETIHYGRLKITGALLSKSKILQGVRNGLFAGWDDPRLATFAALRRRGITPEAIRRLILEVGPKPVDVTLSWENLYAYNRKIIDPVANRYFFIHKPTRMVVGEVPKTFTAKLPLHPDHPERGYRQFKIKPTDGEATFLISGDDMSLLKEGRIIRLMGLFNVRIQSIRENLVEATFYSESHKEAKRIGAPFIHWIQVDTGVTCEVVMPDASVMAGIAEESCRGLRVNQVVQFERFGFVRIDRVEGKLVAYFAHR